MHVERSRCTVRTRRLHNTALWEEDPMRRTTLTLMSVLAMIITATPAVAGASQGGIVASTSKAPIDYGLVDS